MSTPNLEQKRAALDAVALKFDATVDEDFGEFTLIVSPHNLIALLTSLRDHRDFLFEQLVDLCGVDFDQDARRNDQHPERFAVVYHLLSISKNTRVRVVVYLPEVQPIVRTVVGLWASANWFEREAFDLFGILFEGHPDLRRLLTDYGFVGHPFRKDFPLSGHVEMRYDEEKGRVIYEPVSIEPRVTVPRVVR
ncbi:MAG: NADH-quinone oxidoreductase subunit C [Proteobacteria bacterium]|jgi:NADH-quinone oxidoreductase subunit C|nr:NADH-quinone oxidoreductase subunit C [Pseudomonadota bacterium]